MEIPDSIYETSQNKCQVCVRSTYVSEQRQHFVICSVVGDEETQVSLVQDGGDTDQASTATGHDGHVLPRILGRLALSVVGIVHLGDSLTQRLDTSGRGIFSGSHCDIDVCGPLEAAFDVILDLGSWTDESALVSAMSLVVTRESFCYAYLGSSLSKVRPLVRLVEEAKLAGSLGAPDHAGGGTGGVKTSVGKMTSVTRYQLVFFALGS